MRGSSQDYYSNYFSGFNTRKKPISNQDTPSSGYSDDNQEEEDEEIENSEQEEKDEGLRNSVSNFTNKESSSLYVISSPSKSNIQKASYINTANAVSINKGKPTGNQKGSGESQYIQGQGDFNQDVNLVSRKIVSISQNNLKMGKIYSKGLSLNSIKIKNPEQIEFDAGATIKDGSIGNSAPLTLKEGGASKNNEAPVFFRKGVANKGLKSARYGRKKENEDLKNPEEIEEPPRLIGDESPKGFEKGIWDNERRRVYMNESIDLQKLIDKAADNSLIELPASTIKITSNLYINKPLKLKGKIGTKLEVTEGSIFVELNEEKVFFSEIAFLFDSELKNRSTELSKRNIPSNQSKEVYEHGANSYQDSNKSNSNTPHTPRESLLPLFVIKGNTNIEISDCVLKSLNASPPSSLRSSEEETKQSLKELHDLCFLIKPFKLDKKPNKNSLVLRSCSVSGFTCCVEAGPYSYILVESSFFSEMRGFTMNISNPRFFRCKSCRFEKIEKSAINIRFSREEGQAVQACTGEPDSRRLNLVEKMPSSVNTSASRRIISISDNEIKYGFSYGISIYSENGIAHQTVHLKIIKNKFIKTTKESIFLKNLNLDCVELQENRVENCCSNGICIQSVIDYMNGDLTEMSQNNILNCSGTGLVLIDSQVRVDRNDINNNDKGGILLKFSESLVDSEIFKKSPLRNIVTACNIYENREYGIAIMGILRGPVIIASSQIYDNYHGIYIKEKHEGSSIRKDEFKKQKKKEQEKTEALVLLEKSKVTNNKSCGIYLEALANSAFISDTIIKENTDQAVYLAEQKECCYIKFKDQDLAKIKENVQGLVGGPGGQYFGDKQGSNGCKGNKCIVF